MINKGFRVTLACSLTNFILGTFYAWSVFADGLIKELDWTKTQAAMPFVVDILFFAFMMAVAGRYQDKIGPRLIVTLGGILAGSGFILCALFPTPTGIALSFGVLFGTGSSFGYAAVIPAAIKWFPPERKGLITGIVVMSQGAAALVWPALVTSLIAYTGIINTFAIWGVSLLVLITLLAQAISVPETHMDAKHFEATESVTIQKLINPTFVILWLMMGFSIGTGHMLTAHLVVIADVNYQLQQGYLIVTLFALFNTIGRLIGGIIADRVGCFNALKMHFLALVVSMLLFLYSGGWRGVFVATVIFGMGCGGLFTVFPASVAEIFGLKNFGLNYGLLFTGVGIGGALGPYFSGYLADKFGTYNPTFIIGIVACSGALLLSYLLYKKVYISTSFETGKLPG